MEDNNFSVLIPLTRRTVPAIIAQDIINTQPLSFGEASVEFTSKPFENGKFLLHIQIKRFGVMGQLEPILSDIEEYITETFGRRVTKTNGLNYIFDQEKDLTMFFLKWSK